MRFLICEETYIPFLLKPTLFRYLTEEATVEELSQDDQIVAQARRMGIEIDEAMTREQKVQAVRLKMREMIVTEAHRRAGAQVVEGGDAPAYPMPDMAQMAQMAAPVPEGDEHEDELSDEEEDEDEPDLAHPDPAPLLQVPGMPAMGGVFAPPPPDGAPLNPDQEQQQAIGMAQQQIMAEMRATAAMGEDGLGLGGYQAKSRFGEFVDTFTGLVCAAQEFVREFHGGERSSASLRDVARCIKVALARDDGTWLVSDSAI